jgi:hypothetical protein
MQQLPAPLAALGAYRQFIVYLLAPRDDGSGKMDKFPFDPRVNRVASAHDVTIWLSFVEAVAEATKRGEGFGVGFVLTERDPFWCIDVDGAYQNGEWSAVALQLFNYFKGCAIEISQSGTGVHIFGSGIPPAHRCKNIIYGLEMYHSLRFIALTGNGAIGDAGMDATSLLQGAVDAYFPATSERETGPQEWTNEPDELWRGPTDDNDLLRRAMQSKSVASAFGVKASFADLWSANESILAQTYPPDPGNRKGIAYDESYADIALAQHLAFWTGRNCDRILNLMQQSKLVRSKWERPDYLPRTIMRAVSRQIDVLQDKPMELPSAVASQDSVVEHPSVAVVTGETFLGIDGQYTLFEGCVYVRSHHKVFCPGGFMLKPEQFRVHFGGYQFTMSMDNGKVTRDAWEAFTQNELFRCPKVESTCFRPNLTPGAIVNVNGHAFVNIYWPVVVPSAEGDPSLFLDHLARVLPNERDRSILLAYMAAIVQFKGVKFQWSPLLQGVEGNGKTILSKCVAEAIGERYVHWPVASKLANQFNSWMANKIFYAVEDIYVPDARREIIEELKPMITSTRFETEAKGIDQVMIDICGNFIFNSNHLDAIRKTANDRRFCILYCAQQHVSHLSRDGMTGDYLPKLWDWLRAEGYAIVTHYLNNYAIPDELNPAKGAQRAPESSSTPEAIANSAGAVEQEIAEAVEQGLPGFCGGWVSSIFFDRLLERLQLARRVTHRRRKEILEGMGYVVHPALHAGRVDNVVSPDGGKPRLYVLAGSLASQVTDRAAVAHEYERMNRDANRPAISRAFGR